MKKFAKVPVLTPLLLLVILPTWAADLHRQSFECDQTPIVEGRSELRLCKIPAATPEGFKTFRLLVQKGTFVENQYAQGRLLAPEIEKGALWEMLASQDLTKQKLSPAAFVFAREMLDCYRSRVHHSLSKEFLAANASLQKGYRDGMIARGKIPEFDDQAVLNANLGIEVGNILYGVMHDLEVKKLKGIAQVLGNCGDHFAKPSVLWELIRAFVHRDHEKHKMGCIGFAAPGGITRGGGLVHGRNFDQGTLMNSWNTAPVAYLVAEPGRHRYVATGTAGLMFPGGISGFNDQGISVSLHQMDSTHTDSKHRAGTAEMLPVLQQRILRETSSIDEAFSLIRKTGIIASWTILIGDAKTNEVASIEISSRDQVIARRSHSQGLGQSNHFVSPQMAKDHFHSRIASYMETWSRLNFMQGALDASEGQIDVDWGIRALSAHQDMFEGLRAFARTPVKAVNLVSNIMLPKEREFWVTLGDTQPAAHSQFLGFAVDFEKLTLTPIARTRTDAFADRPEWEKSLTTFVEAFKLYRGPHDIAGAIRLIDQARAEAAADGIDEYTYEYIRMKLALEVGDLETAYALVVHLEEHAHLPANTRAGLHLHRVWIEISRTLVPGSTLTLDRPALLARLDLAKSQLHAIPADFRKWSTHDYAAKVELASTLRKVARGKRVKKFPKLPPLYFGLVD